MMATAPLTEEFSMTNHKIVVHAEEGDISMNLCVQQVIVRALHPVMEGHQCSINMDWMDICLLDYYTCNINGTVCSDWCNEKQIDMDWL